MVLWRITNYAVLDGAGGLRASGRWHTRGRRVVYLSSSPSSALLEILVHLEVPVGDLPRSYNLLEINVPDEVVVEDVEEIVRLPEDWTNSQAVTQRLGDSWLNRNSGALLKVPSALAPHTSNFLMNPRHPDAARITIASIGQHPIDERLLR